MNVQMGDLRDALTIRTPAAAATPTAPPAPAPEKPPVATPEPPTRAESAAGPDAVARPAVDPLQWWGAVTQQFSELAAAALKDGAATPPAAQTAKVPGAAPRASRAAAKSGTGRGARSAATPTTSRAPRKAVARRPR